MRLERWVTLRNADMRKSAIVLCLLHGYAGWGQTEAVVEIDAAKVEHSIPRTIYGTFLEPIGHSTYGGLWAQALENPSFEDNLWSAARIRQMLTERPELVESSGIGLPLPWQPLDSAQGWRYEPRWDSAANSARSLLIMGLPEKQTGVRQEVYLPAHRVLRYTGSIYAKPVSGPREIEISLRKRNRPLAHRRRGRGRGRDRGRGRRMKGDPIALSLSKPVLSPVEGGPQVYSPRATG